MVKTGRPRAVEWDKVVPELLGVRQRGGTYADCADYVSDRYDVRVSPQTVRLRILEHAKDTGASLPASVVHQEAPVDPEAEKTMKDKIYAWLLENPAATIAEIADGTGLSVDAVTALHEVVKEENRGYVITPVRKRRESFSETEMMDALADAMDAMGIPEGQSMSQQQYAFWRNSLAPDEKRYFPSPLAYRRRYEAWGNALEAAGLPRHERPREYEGTTKEDAIVWLAHFLRDLKESYPYMVEATVPEYRHWLRSHREAPSEELLRIKGSWGELLLAAAKLERSSKTLPKPRPVWTGGRNKNERNKFVPQ